MLELGGKNPCMVLDDAEDLDAMAARGERRVLEHGRRKRPVHAAIAATFIVAVPPVIRLVAHGFRATPAEFIALGDATGATPRDAFLKIRAPFALPSIMAGINRSLMMAFGMVVIAGIVGSGGLGETIYGAVRKLDIALSVNAAVAIVVLTILLDRISQSAGARRGGLA